MFALFNLHYLDTNTHFGYYIIEAENYIFMGYNLKEAQKNYKKYKGDK
jgi:hypothetical protein